MGDKQDLDTVKSGIGAMLIFVSLLFFGFLLFAGLILVDGDTITIPVRTNAFAKENPEPEISTPYGMYETSTIGELQFSPKNFWQAIVYLNFASVDIYELAFLFVITLLLYRNVRKINDATIFSSQLRWGLKLIGIFSILYATMGSSFINQLQRSSISEWTNGQFSFNGSQHEFAIIVMGMFLGLAAFLSQKGEELQQDQELTI